MQKLSDAGSTSSSLLAGLAIVLVLTLATMLAHAAARVTPDRSEQVLIRVREMSSALRRPILPSERHRSLRLLSHLGTEHTEPHRAAIRSLAETGVPAASYALVEVLKDPEFPYRAEAAYALGTLAHRVALQPLIEVLDDRDAELRRVAAHALGNVARAGVASDTLVEVAASRLAATLTNDPDPVVRAAALHGLSSVGGGLRTASRIVSREADPLVKCEFLKLASFFAKLSGKATSIRASRQMLWKVFRDEQARPSRGVLARVLSLWRNRSAIDGRSYCTDLREAAVEGLASLHDAAALRMLLRLARSASDAPMRATAVRGLAEYGGGPAFATIVEALDDEILGVRLAAIEALRSSRNPRAARHLAAMLESGAAVDRLAAATALGDLPGESAALVEALGDDAVQVRVAAETALLQRSVRVEMLENERANHDEEGDERSGRRIETKERRQRWSLQQWRLARSEAEQALGQALSADDEGVRYRAARVLAAYRGKESRALLIAALRSGVSPRSATAAFALGLRGDTESREDLERAAAAADVDVAVASIRALQDLGRPESLPALRAHSAEAPSEEVRSAARLAAEMLVMRLGHEAESGQR